MHVRLVLAEEVVHTTAGEQHWYRAGDGFCSILHLVSILYHSAVPQEPCA